MLEILKKRLEKAGIPFYEITGATPKEKRIELVNAFNADSTPVFLISLKAGGTGLNLTGADIVIHYDPWWNLAVQNQATDRAHRIGQRKVVTVFKLIAHGTIEDKIVEMQEKKRALAESILESDGISSATLSRDDLLELLN
jgi:SNF2 family DNA or RNA helicase